MKNRNFLLITSLILVAAIFRLMPHPPNVTPVAAMALMGGMYFSRKIFAFIIPILALFISDLVINNTIGKVFFPAHDGLVVFNEYMIPVYLAFILTGLIGISLARLSSFKKIIFGTLLASISFFIITNFGAWLSSPIYPKNILGLIECYMAALPFFRNTLIGNALFITTFVVAYEWFRSMVVSPQSA